jgi:hypothetical protein
MISDKALLYSSLKFFLNFVFELLINTPQNDKNRENYCFVLGMRANEFQ